MGYKKAYDLTSLKTLIESNAMISEALSIYLKGSSGGGIKSIFKLDIQFNHLASLFEEVKPFAARYAKEMAFEYKSIQEIIDCTGGMFTTYQISEINVAQAHLLKKVERLIQSPSFLTGNVPLSNKEFYKTFLEAHLVEAGCLIFFKDVGLTPTDVPAIQIEAEIYKLFQ